MSTHRGNEPGRIDLWCAFYEEIDDEALLAQYRSLLSDAERAQETRFRFARDRRCYLVTRALVRTVLSRYLDVPPGQLRFENNEYGRPFIATDSISVGNLSFNVSHTLGLTALGVSREHTLGIDTENVGMRPAPLEIADRVFAASEVKDLEALPPSARPQRFFEYWTLKESYIKAHGMGLSIPLGAFSFQLTPPHGIDIVIETELEDRPERWNFSHVRVREDHLVAVCAERRTGAPTHLVCTQSVPLVCDVPLQYSAVRYADKQQL